MTPSEDRRYRIALLVATPIVVLLGIVAAVQDWSLGWIYLSIGVLFASAMTYVHYERPSERAERERASRDRSLRR